MEWKWVAYGVLGLGILAALFDLLTASLRVLFSTQEYGLPLRSTRSYFVSGIYGLLALATLAWLFYGNHIGEFWTVMIGCLVWLPLGVYLIWRIYDEAVAAGRVRAHEDED